MFRPQTGPVLWLYIVGALAVSFVLFLLLQALPGRARKPLVALITFLAGLFFVVEFVWPVGPDGANALTRFRQPIADVNSILLAFLLGVGVYSIVTVHGRAVVRQRAGWGFSVALLGALAGITVFGFLDKYRPNRYNSGVYDFFFVGGLQSLDATMFSIIAFYIVSAAYRAFRIRSVEATILLVAAFLVMLGQVALGQALTNGLPTEGFGANFRLEVVGNWILTRVNSPAMLAVDFGLGIGLLATALRLWLSLERGSYFDKEL